MEKVIKYFIKDDYPKSKKLPDKIVTSIESENIYPYIIYLIQVLNFNKGVSKQITDIFIKKSQNDYKFASFFYWYISVEVSMNTLIQSNSIFFSIHNRFMKRVSKSTITNLRGEKEFILYMMSNLKKINSNYQRYDIEYKTRKISELFKREFFLKKPVSYILDPENGLSITGIVPETVKIYASVNFPMSITVKLIDENENESEAAMMFKVGDDLRQDQFVLSMFKIFDELLLKNGLNMYFTHYSIITTGQNEGVIEFVKDSVSLSSVLNRDIDKFESSLHYDESQEGIFGSYGSQRSYGSDNNINKFWDYNCNGNGININNDGLYHTPIDVFIKSCAGYTISTYLLNVGDRHKDNIMVKPTGELFHIDFSYIFGRDPKPFTGEMRITKEMVDAMGGRDSDQFHEFKEYCWEVFKIYRNNYKFILGLLELMKDDQIPDLSILQNSETVILDVKKRLKLELNDEDSKKGLFKIIEETCDAVLPEIFDIIHGVSVMMM